MVTYCYKKHTEILAPGSQYLQNLWGRYTYRKRTKKASYCVHFRTLIVDTSCHDLDSECFQKAPVLRFSIIHEFYYLLIEPVENRIYWICVLIMYFSGGPWILTRDLLYEIFPTFSSFLCDYFSTKFIMDQAFEKMSHTICTFSFYNKAFLTSWVVGFRFML